MSEPATGTVAGLAGWKAIGGLTGVLAGGAGLAALVVLCMHPPRSRPEWVVGIICTLMASICGGAGVVQWLGLQALTGTYIGLVALFGIVFTCGLPGWFLVRATFRYMDRRTDRDIGEIAAELRRQLGGPSP